MPDSPRNFNATRWSLVSRAQSRGEPAAERALNELCQAYWYPLYAFVRRSGHDPDQAADLTQDYFAWFLERHYLERADPERGRLRSFLLHYLKLFMRNEYRKQNAQKRQGSRVHISFDHEWAEARLTQEVSVNPNAEIMFDLHWAQSVFERGSSSVRSGFEAKGLVDRYETLRPFLSIDGEANQYKQAAESLGVTESSVRGMVHRLREKFRDALFLEVRDTMDDPRDEEVQRELSYLIKVLSAE